LDVLLFDSITEYGHSSVRRHSRFPADKVFTADEKLFLQKKNLDTSAGIATAWGKLLRKSFLHEHALKHDERLKQGAEGIEFCNRLYAAGGRVSRVERAFYHYNYNEDSISHRHDEDNHEMVFQCYQAIYDRISGDDIVEEFRVRLLQSVISVAINGYFSPMNKEPFRNKRAKFNAFINREIVMDALKNADASRLSASHRMAHFLIRHRLYCAVGIISKLHKLHYQWR